MTIDERFVQLAREIPGFGGYYRDAAGNLNVVLTNPAAQGQAARSALARVVSAGRGRSMVMRQGRYDFAQLQVWRQQVDGAVLAIGGVAFTDVNEVTNRVEIGIWDATVHGQVRSALSGLSIPQPAVALVEAGRVEEHASIRERVRPATGGLQITRILSSGNTSYCTLGFTVLMDGKYGYLTNSHCTASGIGTVHRQDGSNDRIGAEVEDPAAFPYQSTQTFNGVSYTCMDSSGCRFSDASRGVFDDSVQAQVKHGYIARTLTENEYQGGNPDSTVYGATVHTINSSVPYFRIVGKATDVMVGDTIHKVGWRTGWTSGPVDRTCVTSSNGMFCQLSRGIDDFVTFGRSGDSGSPVFRRVPGRETDVELVGLYWGNYTSPIANIERDMGTTFAVAAPPSSPYPHSSLPAQVQTAVSPSAVLLNDTTFVFFKGANDSRIYMTRTAGTPYQGTWSDTVQLPDFIGTSDAPSAVVIGSTLHVAYKGAGTDTRIWVAESSNRGTTWSIRNLSDHVNTSTRPGAFVFAGSLYVVYKGWTGDERLYVAPPSGTPPFVILPSTVNSSASPSAVRVNDTTFVFYKGAGSDPGIYMARNAVGPGLGTAWTYEGPLPGVVKTSDAPSAAVIGSTIYVVYKDSGTRTGVFVLRSSNRGQSWERTRLEVEVNTSTRPDVLVSGSSLYVVYKGWPGDPHVYVAPLPGNAWWQPI